jgi:hypothetical protein
LGTLTRLAPLAGFSGSSWQCVDPASPVRRVSRADEPAPAYRDGRPAQTNTRAHPMRRSSPHLPTLTVMQAPVGRKKIARGPSTAGWSVNYWDDLMGQAMEDLWASPLTSSGFKTMRFSPPTGRHVTDDPADILNNSTKYVVTSTLERRLAAFEPGQGRRVAQIQALKQPEAPRSRSWGAPPYPDLDQARLVDEFRLQIFLSSSALSASSATAPSPLASASSTQRSPPPASSSPLTSVLGHQLRLVRSEQPTDAEVERARRSQT